jgi:type IV fimbrial biogenesis protein FimT
MRMTTITNEFITALNVARSEAVKRNVKVSIRKSDNQSSTKNGTNWENGWDIFTDPDGDGIFVDNKIAPLCEENEDCLLKTHQALLSGYSLRGNKFVADFVSYLPNGEINMSALGGSFYLCYKNQISNAKIVILNAIGRPRLGIDKNNNGLMEDGTTSDITVDKCSL